MAGRTASMRTTPARPETRVSAPARMARLRSSVMPMAPDESAHPWRLSRRSIHSLSVSAVHE